MQPNATVHISSIYKGQKLFDLALSYEKLNLLLPTSGTGKTALGYFLREESFRRLGIDSSGVSFNPKVDWELTVQGPLGFVEYLPRELRGEKLIDYLNLTGALENLFRRDGKSLCPKCKGELAGREKEEFFINIGFQVKEQGLVALLGIELTVTPEQFLNLLEWARQHAVLRAVLEEEIVNLPLESLGDARFGKVLFESGRAERKVTLLRQVITSDSLDSDLSSGIGTLIEVASVVNGEPVVLCGEIAQGEKRKFKEEKRLN